MVGKDEGSQLRDSQPLDINRVRHIVYGETCELCEIACWTSA